MADASFNEAAIAAPPSDKASTTDKDKGKAKKPSLAVRERKAEKYREKKNEKTMEKLAQKFENTKLSFGYTSSDLFGDRVLASSTKPPLRVEVTTHFAADIARETIGVLHYSCKIAPPAGLVGEHAVEHDFRTLLNATALQLSAKFYYANLKSKFARISDAQNYINFQQTANILNRAVTPMAVFIDQIGFTDFDGQRFHPMSSQDMALTVEGLRNPSNSIFHRFNFLSPVTMPRSYSLAAPMLSLRGLPLDFVFANDQQVDRARQVGLLYAEAGREVLNMDVLRQLTHEQIYEFGAIVEHLVTDAVLPFAETCERYINFLGRVERKLQSTAIVELNLEAGRGCNSQLVGCCRSDNGVVTCVSARSVTDDACVMSAMLELGYAVDEPMYSTDVHVKQLVVDATASATALANYLVRKLRA